MLDDSKGIAPQIWIGCLAAYNAGHLHGEWVDADQDPDDLEKAKNRILADSPIHPAEEWFIADYEYLPSRLGEHAAFELISESAAFITGADNPELALAVLEESADVEQAKSIMDSHCGAWDSLSDYAADMVDDLGGIPEGHWLSGYIDHESLGRDLAHDHRVIEHGGQFHIFNE